MGMNISKPDFLLSAIYEDAHRELNPSDEQCPDCGGEGYIADCFDGFCVDAESGCEDCMKRCGECARFDRSIERYVRVQVLRAMDLDLTRAWARRRGRGADVAEMDDSRVLLELHAGRAACKDFTDQERGDSGCWVEGLM